jgi:hypothetical protein
MADLTQRSSYQVELQLKLQNQTIMHFHIQITQRQNWSHAQCPPVTF